jgi:hypothetical protein
MGMKTFDWTLHVRQQRLNLERNQSGRLLVKQPSLTESALM